MPLRARELSPAPGSADVDPRVVLNWRAGRQAVTHEVYLGSDPNDLSPADVVTGAPYAAYDTTALDLHLGATYYWQVNEVNELEVPAVWEGDVSEFSTRPSLVVDDFESYTNDAATFSRVFQTWIDGAGYTNPVEVAGNGTGSYIGHDPSLGDIMETGSVHGGTQSAPLYYGNGGQSVSEVDRTFDEPQDWTRAGVHGLVLYFYGHSENAPVQLYVKVNNTQVLYDGDMEALQRMSWQKWYIPLADHLTSSELAQVKSLTIGVDGSGGGILLVDDISLTADSRNLITPARPTPDNLVAHYAFDGDTLDSTGAHPATAMGLSNFETGKVGQAISLAGMFGDYVELTGYKGILGSSAITVMAWINTSATETGTIIGWGPATADGGRFGFRVDDNRIRCEFSGGNVQGTTTINHGGWQHVAVTVKANATISYPEVTLWVDGVDDTQPSTDETIINILADDTQDARIGSRPSAEDRWFGGLIDELYIYDRVLTAEEIAGAAGRSAPFDQ